MEDIVIVGAGIAGLATSLGLHRLGIKSSVLESADSLRATGFALGIYTNAWRALDAIGVGDILRATHIKLSGVVTTSVISGGMSEVPFGAIDSQNDHDIRAVNRKMLLETLENELPRNTIRYSSKVVHIENEDRLKLLHLADGTVIRTKVLIGCDGVNSVVAKFLGFGEPSSAGRSEARGFTYFECGHGFEPNLMLFFGKGLRYGVIPCDDYGVYWFFNFGPSPQEKEVEEDPAKLKQFILSKLGKVCDKIKQVFEQTELENMVCSPLRFRHPWKLIWGNISKENICVLGDALHPMTPDLGQGGCCALEDSIVLARILGVALKGKASSDEKQRTNYEENEQHRRIQKGLEKFARERRWRSIDLISTSYMVGFMQQSDGGFMHFIRDKLMAKLLAGVSLKKATFDCGKLTLS